MGRRRRQIIVPLTVALLGILVAEPIPAMQSHGHHHAPNGSTKEPSKMGRGTAQTAKREKSVATRPSDTLDIEAPPPLSRLPLKPDRNGDASSNSKLSKPEHLQPHLPPASNGAVRNAIGQSVIPHISPQTVRHLGSAQAPNPEPGINRAVVSRGLRQPNIGGANSTNSGGTGVIRPSPLREGVGGPAKPVAEIGGSMMQPKR